MEPKMTEVELAHLFVKYASLKDQLDILAALIEEEVLARGETVKIAGVTATYYKAGKEYQYESAAQAAMAKLEVPLDLKPFTTTKETVRWKEVCESMFGADQIESAVPAEERPARAAIK
jgi:hypothetical protein